MIAIQNVCDKFFIREKCHYLFFYKTTFSSTNRKRIYFEYKITKLFIYVGRSLLWLRQDQQQHLMFL